MLSCMVGDTRCKRHFRMLQTFRDARHRQAKRRSATSITLNISHIHRRFNGAAAATSP